MSEINLAYVALATRDIDKASAFLGDSLGLQQAAVKAPGGDMRRAFTVGDSALVLFEAGDRFLSTPHPGVDHIALIANDPAKKVASLGLQLWRAKIWD